MNIDSAFFTVLKLMVDGSKKICTMTNRTFSTSGENYLQIALLSTSRESTVSCHEVLHFWKYSHILDPSTYGASFKQHTEFGENL